MTELVSIIIPCYNQARFLHQAAASCLAQNYSALEVLVIDDGSTDDPRAALGELAQHPQLTFMRQENRGVAHARNAGIAASSGTFVKFLDADDWLAPTLVARQVEMLCADPALGFVYCDRIRTDEQGAALDTGTVGKRSASLDGDLFPLLLYGGFFPPMTVMLPRSILERVGNFDQSVVPCEDYDLWLRITAHGYRVQFLNQPLAYYRRHDASATQDRARLESQQRAVLERIVAQFPQRVAGALSELGAHYTEWNAERASRTDRETKQGEWIAQLEQDKAALQIAADTREHYLQQIESHSLFRALVQLGIVPRRQET
jgi:glycosyltransferase involved in cell wall biosynthesis